MIWQHEWIDWSLIGHILAFVGRTQHIWPIDSMFPEQQKRTLPLPIFLFLSPLTVSKGICKHFSEELGSSCDPDALQSCSSVEYAFCNSVTRKCECAASFKQDGEECICEAGKTLEGSTCETGEWQSRPNNIIIVLGQPIFLLMLDCWPSDIDFLRLLAKPSHSLSWVSFLEWGNFLWCQILIIWDGYKEKKCILILIYRMIIMLAYIHTLLQINLFAAVTVAGDHTFLW